MKKKLRIDASGTTKPSPEKVAKFVQAQNSSLADEPAGTEKSLPVKDGERVYTRDDFEQALRKVARPHDQEKS